MKFSTIKRKWNSLIGVPLPWPTSTPPDGFIALAGQAINQATDPLLYARYGATAPDMRGEIVRGYDNGRGVDSGRVLLSAQGDAIRNIAGSILTDNGWFVSSGTGVLRPAGPTVALTKNQTTTGTISTYASWDIDVSRLVPTAAENRMRNIAWNYITMRG